MILTLFNLSIFKSKFLICKLFKIQKCWIFCQFFQSRLLEYIRHNDNKKCNKSNYFQTESLINPHSYIERKNWSQGTKHRKNKIYKLREFWVEFRLYKYSTLKKKYKNKIFIKMLSTNLKSLVCQNLVLVYLQDQLWLVCPDKCLHWLVFDVL